MQNKILILCVGAFLVACSQPAYLSQFDANIIAVYPYGTVFREAASVIEDEKITVYADRLYVLDIIKSWANQKNYKIEFLDPVNQKSMPVLEVRIIKQKDVLLLSLIDSAVINDGRNFSGRTVVKGDSPNINTKEQLISELEEVLKEAGKKVNKHLHINAASIVNIPIDQMQKKTNDFFNRMGMKKEARELLISGKRYWAYRKVRHKDVSDFLIYDEIFVEFSKISDTSTRVELHISEGNQVEFRVKVASIEDSKKLLDQLLQKI